LFKNILLIFKLRRKTLENQRIEKLKEMLEKRRIKQSKIEQTQIEKEKERLETARQKERTREMRLAIMEAQFQANKQQVKKRIMQKQEESSKRHELNLEEIRKKALEMSILRFTNNDDGANNDSNNATTVPYEKSKLCNACNVIINSEMQLKSHLRGAKHQQTMHEMNQGKHLTKTEIEEYNLKCIVDTTKENDSALQQQYNKELQITEERHKAMKKRIKKLKNKLLIKGVEHETLKRPGSSLSSNSTGSLNTMNNSNKNKISKLVKEIEKFLNSNDRQAANLDRNCSELNRLVQKSPLDQNCFKACDGLAISVKLLENILSNSSSLTHESLSALSAKTSCTLINLLTNAIKNNQESCLEILMSNKLLSLIEILSIYSNIMLNDHFDGGIIENNNSTSYEWLICSNIILLIEHLFSFLNCENGTNAIESNEIVQRAIDFTR
jgi:hypothetical protein